MSGRAPVPSVTRYSRFAAVVTSNTTTYGFAGTPPTEDIAAVYVGTTGDVSVVGTDGVAATFKNVPQGTTLQISPLKITAGTTLVALFW